VGDEVTFPLAKQGVFITLNGEGAFIGRPMVFIRLAGCSENCPDCDTDYRLDSRATASVLAQRAVNVATPGCSWAWVTGGEPTIHDLKPLYAALRTVGFKIALATAGVKPVGPLGWVEGGPDFVSVSPHRLDDSWVQRSGDHVNVVPGLNGLTLTHLDAVPPAWFERFSRRYVTPLRYGPAGVLSNLQECKDWVMAHSGWSLGIQAHHHWGVP
jgi:7-carboxy-7-deazaguanine synthase